MLHDVIKVMILRELAAMQRSVEAYPDDASVWAMPAGVPNAAGTLVLHIAGNLQHFVGTVLGGSGYRRDRPAEFARRDVPRAELVAELAATAKAVERALPTVSAKTLSSPYPETIGGRVLTTEAFLVHLAAHLAYHLGQLDYHRRIVTGDSRSIGAMSITELGEPSS